VLVRDLELAALVLDLAEQSHVLDRNHGRVRERGSHTHFARSERADLVAPQREHADRLALAKHRHAEHGPKADSALGLGPHVGRIGRGILDLNNLARERRPADQRSGNRRNRVGAHVIHVLRRATVARHQMEQAVVLADEDESAVRPGESGRVLRSTWPAPVRARMWYG